MPALLLEAAVRATLVAAGTACVLWALRIRTAALRHAAWTMVVVAMLLLPLWSLAGPSVRLAVLPAGTTPVASGASGDAGSGSNAPGTVPAARGPSPAAEATALAGGMSPVVLALALVYLLGALVLLGRLAYGTLQAHRLRRGAKLRDGRPTSARCATPITVGWLSPVLVLPEGWDLWPARRLAAVEAHEHEHARRRDPLVLWLALLNRAVFWFHPLAWWLERRLASLAEEVCDDAVIRAGHSPQDYSDDLLDMARALGRRGRRLAAVGTAMPGNNLARRLRRIFEERPMTPLTRTRVTCTLALCVASSMICAATVLTPRPSAGADARAAAADPGDRADFSGHWVLVSATYAGRGRGGTGTPGVEREVMTRWVSGAPVNCGPDCTMAQDAKTLTITLPEHPETPPPFAVPTVVLNLDGSDSHVVPTGGPTLAAHANWMGSRLAVTCVWEHLSTTLKPAFSTVTQVIWIDDGRLKIVTDTGHGDAPVTFTYARR